MTASQPLRTMMVDTQIRPSDVTKFPIIAAMLDVPREEFVPMAARPVAYMDAPVPLGDGREMPEARTFAKMLDALDLVAEDEVLIVGGGYGYSAAVLARMTGSVVMVEEDPSMVSEAESTLAAQGVDNAAVISGALAEGAPKAAPFDVILIEGGVETIPAALTDQLKEDGRMVALFQKGALGECRVGHKSGDRVAWRFAFNAAAPVLPGFTAARAFTL
ncbi:protein-L-isoaspartate O-methyltransferase family protein [Jannaschia seohaensis]|uniref:Protein-L-isoaspartate O-methyltransferase n=1 Tax=Jannaschia seohaensis TaxID=475081 RepID=A0A2Y9AK56_9RHOB|nr:protein-L-isoaspartate O-methyltransferase [Jannaschia seohaensis]PWJ20444.1 protein-L-isoaspartate(D-aspartate) O-methyltransferase [Jannaschia seohaensis]SSA44535.1 protein-L-isoaspartate(D-aspartate) O-methyltransferase [Jannaschia seohaensis]